jgi:hypothetical protein
VTGVEKVLVLVPVIDAVPVGVSGVAGLYVKSLMIVTVQSTVTAPSRLEPVSLHWVTLAPPAVTLPRDMAAPVNPKTTAMATRAKKSLRRKRGVLVGTGGSAFSRSGRTKQHPGGACRSAFW